MSTSKNSRMLVWVLLVAGAAFGQTAPFAQTTPTPQTAPSRPTFVSATVKPSVRSDLTSQRTRIDTNTGMIEQVKNNYAFPRSMRVDASQLQYGNMPFIDLIAIAYNVKLDQISGPGWLNDDTIRHRGEAAQWGHQRRDSSDVSVPAARPLQTGRPPRNQKPASAGAGGGQGRAEAPAGHRQSSADRWQPPCTAPTSRYAIRASSHPHR